MSAMIAAVVEMTRSGHLFGHEELHVIGGRFAKVCSARGVEHVVASSRGRSGSRSVRRAAGSRRISWPIASRSCLLPPGSGRCVAVADAAGPAIEASAMSAAIKRPRETRNQPLSALIMEILKEHQRWASSGGEAD